MQRVMSALRKEETDRVHERTAERFARFTLDFYNKYDPDYVKVMYDENYDTPVNTYFVNAVEVWKRLEEYDPHIGAFGRQLQSLKQIKDTVGPDVPVIQTIFSPFHIAQRLAYRRILEDWKQDPEAVRQATILILHIHGEKQAYFDLLKGYDCDAISWEDRLAGPSVADARTLTDKCLVGGIDHYKALDCAPGEIVRQGREAVEAVGSRGLILAPGCTFFDETPTENILAMKQAVGA